MAVPTNRPSIDRLKRQLTGLPKLDSYSDLFLQELLSASIAWVEEEATTSFDPVVIIEKRDGNATNQMTLFKRPVLDLMSLSVQTPILGYTRVYTAEEIKNYVKQGIVKVFTYKLAVEQALLRTVDYMAWGTLFPPLPQSVVIEYSYGYPVYDEDLNQTTFDGVTWDAGDLRDLQLVRNLAQLQQAAVIDAAASLLGQVGGLSVGTLASVSFDGYSRGLNPQAYGSQVQALIAKRDELMARRKRLFHMATIG